MASPLWRMLVTDPGDPIIFLVDEDDVVRDSLRILLESHGMQVREFCSTRDFLAKSGIAIGARPARTCLVLGFNRLIMDGVDLMAELRHRGIDLPVLFIVGGGDQSQKITVGQSGAFAYLERPVQEAVLIRAIKSALSREVDKANAGGRVSPHAVMSAGGKTRR